MTLTGRDVEVIVPAFNAASFIDEALGSILEQTCPPRSVIVVDDGSTDATAERCAAWGTQVVLVRQSNHGPGRARNVGVAHSSAPLLAFHDADDVWMPTKLELQLAHLNSHPQDIAVFGWMHNFVEPGCTVVPDPRTPMDPRPAYQAVTMLARREVMERVGPFDEVGPIQGWVDWYLRLRESGLPLAMVPEVVVRRRIHGDNLTLRERANFSEYHRLLHASLQRRRANQQGGE